MVGQAGYPVAPEHPYLADEITITGSMTQCKQVIIKIFHSVLMSKNIRWWTIGQPLKVALGRSGDFIF
jgi:hypothetical protein